MTVGYWFRRDLRVADNEALTLATRSAKAASTAVYPFYLSQSFSTYKSEFKPSELRQRSLYGSLLALDETLNNTLGHAATLEDLLPALSKSGTKLVYAMKSFDPEGLVAETKMTAALASIGVQLVLAGSAYSISPGSVLKDDGTPVKVYTPFFRRWAALEHKPKLPSADADFRRLELPSLEIGSDPSHDQLRVGEKNALRTLERFLQSRILNYSQLRDRADIGGTSHLSHALSHGEIHPRTILEALPFGEGAEIFRKELAWREFYADVLHHNPQSLWGFLDEKYSQMRFDEGPIAEERFEAWRLGVTGYPIVDAGMRQLQTTGWMHNRVRMIVASFLVKDLHLPWTRGADWFESQLTDFDPASNAHGWQWTAGCGTDASPYFRVFNPTLQGQKFDPEGNYVRRFVPELAHLSPKEIHEPWKYLTGLAHGYSAPIIDHAAERDEALRRLDELKQRVDRNRNK